MGLIIFFTKMDKSHNLCRLYTNTRSTENKEVVLEIVVQERKYDLIGITESWGFCARVPLVGMTVIVICRSETAVLAASAICQGTGIGKGHREGDRGLKIGPVKMLRLCYQRF